jgi:hypothetical protein
MSNGQQLENVDGRLLEINPATLPLHQRLIVRHRMLSYPHVCSRMLSYADVC